MTATPLPQTTPAVTAEQDRSWFQRMVKRFTGIVRRRKEKEEGTMPRLPVTTAEPVTPVIAPPKIERVTPISSPPVTGKRLMRKIAIINHKGGVGKTSTSVHLSGTLASMGYRVLVVDCDSQGDLSAVYVKKHEHLPVSLADIFNGSPVPIQELIQPTNRENVFVVTADDRLDEVDRTAGFETDPAVQSLADAISQVESEYDFILFDCPPRRHLISFAALVAASEVIIPCEPERFSVRSMARLGEEIKRVQSQLNPQLIVKGYFLSKFSPRNAGHKKYREMLVQSLGEDIVFKTAIPDQGMFKTAINVGKPVCDHSPKSKAAQAMKDFALELIGEVH